MTLLRNYFITFAAFMGIDLIWLGVVARDLYRAQIGFLLKSEVNWTAAVLFYVLYLMGMQFFVIYPALKRGSGRYALLTGLLFGFITYMTYDLTNLATLKDWPLMLTLIDMLWGTVLGGATSWLSFVLIRKFR